MLKSSEHKIGLSGNTKATFGRIPIAETPTTPVAICVRRTKMSKTTPAFPLDIIYSKENERFNGMTLRDYFAAKAMQGMITRRILSDPDDALIAYKMADAMMKAREA
jgi:hypothetical protein